jgi:hypothetical protein
MSSNPADDARVAPIAAVPGERLIVPEFFRRHRAVRGLGIFPDFAAARFGLRLRHRARNFSGTLMSNGLSLPELERRIAIARDNIRQLIEQAAAFSGAEDEDRAADRIAQQQEELDKLVKERDALLKK